MANRLSKVGSRRGGLTSPPRLSLIGMPSRLRACKGRGLRPRQSLRVASAGLSDAGLPRARPVGRCRGGLRSAYGCKRSASIGLPQRCHGVPPECTAAAENWLGACISRNTAEHVYMIEAAHNPEVAGSNPAPATAKGPGNGAFRSLGGYAAAGGRDGPGSSPAGSTVSCGRPRVACRQSGGLASLRKA